ncbi:MAG: hypothetical protein QXH14_08430 [Candidatus Caldarchaeum sp.]
MPTLAYNKFQVFVEHLANKVHDLFGSGANADTLKVYLSNTAPDAATHQVKADLAEITAGNGYPAGGVALPNQSGTRSGGTFSLTADQITITASGGSIGPFRYFVLYNDTPTSPADPLIAWWDYGSALTLQDGDSITLRFNGQQTGGTVMTIS